MGLRFGDEMGLRNLMTRKGHLITRISIRAELPDLAPLLFDLSIKVHRGTYAFSNRIGNNATLCSTISSPYDGPLLFF